MDVSEHQAVAVEHTQPWTTESHLPHYRLGIEMDYLIVVFTLQNFP